MNNEDVYGRALAKLALLITIPREMSVSGIPVFLDPKNVKVYMGHPCRCDNSALSNRLYEHGSDDYA